MGLIEDASRRFLAAYREGLEMSCPFHGETKQKLVEKAAERRDKIRSTIAARRKRRAH